MRQPEPDARCRRRRRSTLACLRSRRLGTLGRSLTRLLGCAAALTTLAGPAAAAGLDGRALGLAWTLPFAGMLLSIAILPQLAPHLWERRVGTVAAIWAALTLVPLGLAQGWGAAWDAALHVALGDYVPFVLLIFALYTIAGGVVVAGNLHGSPAVNTGLLAAGTVLASLIGTTGAAMILVRPLIRANDDRRHNAHVFVFFIFLVANVGGALTPLGDPPLFLGFLRGVPFFWTLQELLAETAFAVAVLLGAFYAIDRVVYRRDDVRPPLAADPTPDTRLYLRGKVNLLLLALLIGAVVTSGIWRPGISFEIGSVRLELQSLLRDLALLALALASIALTSRGVRAANAFSWHPMIEVAQVFAGIFVCLIPVSASLEAGRDGAFASLLALVSGADGTPIPAAYFWMTGLLSSVLDNAPTYIVFFELAGGDPVRLTGPLAHTLAAISTGAVFMGALTYLGNAPNLMVYTIARHQGVRMPSFGGYLLWSGTVLLPLFGLCTLIFFR